MTLPSSYSDGPRQDTRALQTHSYDPVWSGPRGSTPVHHPDRQSTVHGRTLPLCPLSRLTTCGWTRFVILSESGSFGRSRKYVYFSGVPRDLKYVNSKITELFDTTTTGVQKEPDSCTLLPPRRETSTTLEELPLSRPSSPSLSCPSNLSRRPGVTLAPFGKDVILSNWEGHWDPPSTLHPTTLSDEVPYVGRTTVSTLGLGPVDRVLESRRGDVTRTRVIPVGRRLSQRGRHYT